MYLRKIEYLRSLFPADNCVSAITVAETSTGTPVGTPCTVNINPFAISKPVMSNPRSAKEVRNDYLTSGEQPYTYRTSRDRISMPKTKKAPARRTEKICVNDLYKMSLAEANNMMRQYINKSNVLFAFGTNNNYIDFYTVNLHSQHIYFNGIKPLILDDGSRFELSRLSDAHSKGDLANFAEMVYSSLQDNRYVNYTFTGVAESNKVHMMEDINIIFNNLKNTYPHNIACFQTLSEGVRNLIDVISISFYRLPDVTAIFDINNSMGVGVEVLMTNSVHDATAISKEGRSIVYRFLFSPSRENLFTIDGEIIVRKSDCKTDMIVSNIHKIIHNEIPHDKVSKKVKTNN